MNYITLHEVLIQQEDYDWIKKQKTKRDIITDAEFIKQIVMIMVHNGVVEGKKDADMDAIQDKPKELKLTDVSPEEIKSMKIQEGGE